VTKPQLRNNRTESVPISEILVLVGLGATSGLALAAHILWDLSMTWLAGFVVLPASAFLVILAFLGQGRTDRAKIFSNRIIAGAVFGLMATLVYDISRPLLVEVFQLDFNPYRAHPIFGSLITGRPESDDVAVAVGWAYHFWNGISFGMMLALILPRATWWQGLIWAEALQFFMMMLYPRFLEVRLDDPAFLATGLVGHGLYGIVLGLLLNRYGPTSDKPITWSRE
jgi:hypothetical protein